MGTNAAHLSIWAVLAFWACWSWKFVSSARAEERRRREEGLPHTTKDTLLLLLSALTVVGILLCAMFLKPLGVLFNSRAGVIALILLVGGGLTYLFNRKRDVPHR